MNIVFLTRFDPKDINLWSGTLYHIYHKLKEKHTVEIIGPEILGQLALFKRGNFSGNTFMPNDRYVKSLGRLLSERINALGYDLIFFGDLLFIPFDVNLPIVLFSDITFEQVKIHYVKSDKRDIESFINLEKILLNTAFKIVYCSEWIKSKAIEIYKTNPNKIEVVEFGANIPAPQNYSIDISMAICRLVFIGKDWIRKGGDIMLQIYKTLKEKKFPCTLTIIGSIPENQEADDDLTIIPCLDKSKEEDLKKLCSILSESHFLVLPTRFDAFGIVFCEASAYALPSITTDVGGVGQTDQNYIQSLNLGIKVSKGKYIARIYTGDIMHIDRLKLQHSIMEEYPDYYRRAEKWLKIYTDWRTSDGVSSIQYQWTMGKKMMLLYNIKAGLDISLKPEDIPSDWVITTDRRFLQKADVVVFHLPHLQYDLENDLDKPDNQIWVGWYMEAEKNNSFLKDPEINAKYTLSEISRNIF